LLAVPILAGSAAYACAETFKLRGGLYLKLRPAPGFYGVIAFSTLLGFATNLIGINPIQARGEHEELARIYVRRGLDPSLAKLAAEQLMVKDALSAHARDELGISETATARPLQAALASAATFSVGAGMPLLILAIAPATHLGAFVTGTSLVFLALLGGLAARTGGVPMMAGMVRVTFWGALAMGLTSAVGALFGTVA
jgi:VIT1/CCC1 family predicted Fe2+/Mn2+ transporter